MSFGINNTVLSAKPYSKTSLAVAAKWCLDGVQCYPNSKVHGANMGPIWGRQDLGGPHVGPMNFGIWVPTFARVYVRYLHWNSVNGKLNHHMVSHLNEA